MEIKSQELINKFIDEYPNKHNLNKKQIQDIINAVYQYIKICMTDDDLPGIRIQYLGEFKPYKGSDVKLKELQGYGLYDEFIEKNKERLRKAFSNPEEFDPNPNFKKNNDEK